MTRVRFLLIVSLGLAVLSVAAADWAAARFAPVFVSQVSPLTSPRPTRTPSAMPSVTPTATPSATPSATPTARVLSGSPTPPLGAAPRFPLGYARVQYPTGATYYRGFFGLLTQSHYAVLLNGAGATLQAVDLDTWTPIWSYTPAALALNPDSAQIAAVAQTEQWVYLLVAFLKGDYLSPDRRYERQLIKLAAKDGRPVWRQIVERDKTEQSSYSLHAAPDDAPDPTVYVTENNSWVVAINAVDGSERWRVGPCGYAAIAGLSSFSALCKFGRPEEERYLYSFDATTGARHSVGFFGLPWPEKIAYTNGKLFAYDADTYNPGAGVHFATFDEFSDRPRWSRNLATDGGAPSAVLLDASGLAVRIRKTIYKFDVHSGDTLWQTDLLDSGRSSFALAEQVLWAIGETGFLHALDWRNGRLLGTQNLTDTLQPAPTAWTTILAATPTELVIAFPFASSEQIAIARLTFAAPSVARNQPPTRTPYPTATPTLSPTPMPTLALPKPLLFPPPTPAPTLPTQMKWDERPGAHAVLADVDDDGAQEWIINREQLLGDHAGPGDEGFRPWTLEYWLFEPSGDSYAMAASWSWESIATVAISRFRPRVLAVTDINGDGKSEIVFHAEGCGATTCFVRLTIWRWDGMRLRDLSGWGIERSYPLTTFPDLDGDGALEIMMRGGMSGSAGAGMQRARIFVYKWQGNQYVLAEERRVESAFALFRVVDAQEALQKGDLARALELARQVVASPHEGSRAESLGFTAEEEARIVSYAALQVMYVYATRGEPERMAFYLDEIKRRYTRSSNPFTEVAQILFDQYQITGNVASACTAAQTAIRHLGSDARLLGPGSISTEGVKPAELCPDVKSAAPQQLPQTGGRYSAGVWQHAIGSQSGTIPK